MGTNFWEGELGTVTLRLTESKNLWVLLIYVFWGKTGKRRPSEYIICLKVQG